MSIAVLGLMMVGVAQLMGGAMSATLGGYKHMDADTQARMVLDRMAFDIAKISKRSDVDYYFSKNSGNDQMAFYSESGGYYPSSASPSTQGGEVSLAGYRINSNYQLERLSKGLIWNGVTPPSDPNPDPPSPMVFLPKTILGTWPQVQGTAGTDTDYQVIGDQIFRLEYCFLVQNNTISAISAGATNPDNTTTVSTNPAIFDSPWYPPDTTINGLQDVVAVIVSIAVLDTQSRTMLGNTAAQNTALQTAVSNLADDGNTTANYPSSATLPVTLWKAKLIGAGLGLPKAVNSQVRFYQRYCYINRVP